MKIQIDHGAGVCPGVARAIRMAENYLEQNRRLVSIGPLIHNRVEIERLAKHGLQTVSQEEFEKNEAWVEKYRNSVLLVRAHGISRALYNKLKRHHFKLLDATCPKVRRVQEIVRSYWIQGYQIVIVGKKGHPEVRGLEGAAGGNATIVLTHDELKNVSTTQKTLIIAQTTTNQENFYQLVDFLKQHIPEIVVENSICKSVSIRHHRLRELARNSDLMVFVGGRNSSNTAELFRICRAENPVSYWIEEPQEIESQWLGGMERIGISGSASTPMWQLERIQLYLQNLSQAHFTKINIKEVQFNG